MSSAHLDTTLEAAFVPVRSAIATGRIPGAVLGLVRADGTRGVRVAGQAQIVPAARPMQASTWFDLASLTKVLFTTPHVLALARAGVLDLDAPLTSLLPDLRQYDAGSWVRRVSFRQCLGHQTPFPAVEPIYTYGHDPDLLRAFVLQRDWRAGPNVYSDINFILLGIALERHHGKRIREMDPGPGFAWSAPADQAAATENCTWRHRVLSGEVHDDNTAALRGAGHAGLFGTVDAVLDHGLHLLRGGGDPLEHAALSATRTHGWERRHPGWPGGDSASAESIGHTGFTGTGLWVDAARGQAWALLANRIHPTRHHDSGIADLRRIVGDIISERGC